MHSTVSHVSVGVAGVKGQVVSGCTLDTLIVHCIGLAILHCSYNTVFVTEGIEVCAGLAVEKLVFIDIVQHASVDLVFSNTSELVHR